MSIHHVFGVSTRLVNYLPEIQPQNSACYMQELPNGGPFKIRVYCNQFPVCHNRTSKVSIHTLKSRGNNSDHVATGTLCILTYLVTPWSRVLLEKLTGSAASQQIPRFFGTRRFITILTSARHMSLSSANSMQSSQPPPTS